MIRRIYPSPYRLKRRSRLSLLKFKYRKLFIYWKNIKDITTGIVKDQLYRNRLEWQPEVKAVQTGGARTDADQPPRRWCLFAAYSPKSLVTEMVLTQLRAYKEAGFSVVFITMSRTISEVDEKKLKDICTHIVRRKSFGRDFGAWVHAARLLGDEIKDADALLLTIDSNLGPIFPLKPWIDACLKQEGVFGLTESLGGGCHLQSYFLMGKGKAAVGAMLDFLRNLKLTHSKWLTIQRGEKGFTEFMRKKDLFIGAVLSYEELENALLENRELQAELEVIFPHVFNGLRSIALEFQNEKISGAGLSYERLRRYFLRSRLFLTPLNPSHQLNSVLLQHFKFPFVKVELVTENPGMAPSAPDWRYAITDESPVTEAMIDDHLATLIK